MGSNTVILDSKEYSKSGGYNRVWFASDTLCDKLMTAIPPYGATITAATISMQVKRASLATGGGWSISDDNGSGGTDISSGSSLPTSYSTKTADIKNYIKNTYPNSSTEGVYYPRYQLIFPSTGAFRFESHTKTLSAYLKDIRLAIEWNDVTITPTVSAGSGGTITYDCGSKGSGDKSWTQTYAGNTGLVYLYPIANTGYTFVDYTINSGAIVNWNGDIRWQCSDFITYESIHPTIVANFRINTSTLKIDPNGGSWNGSTSTQSFTQNYNTTKSIPVPTRTGYKFAGWKRTNTYGTLSSTTAAATYTFGATDAVTDTLTAQWEAISYSITYDYGGGKATNKSNFTVESDTFTLNEPTKEGFEFLGWTGSNGSTAQKSVTIAKGSTGDRTYKANWKATVVAPTFKSVSITYLGSQVSSNNKVISNEGYIISTGVE